MKLRLTLGYLTISPSNESLSFISIHSPLGHACLKPLLEKKTFDTGIKLYSSQSVRQWESLFHINTLLPRTCLPETSARKKTFDTGIKLYSSQLVRQIIGFDTICWENRGKKDQTRIRQDPTHKGMTPPSTQNVKALGSWVLFLICCSTFGFLLNVRLRLTLGYLTISPSSESPSSTLIHCLSSRRLHT